jgi:hypothetical protein
VAGGSNTFAMFRRLAAQFFACSSVSVTVMACSLARYVNTLGAREELAGYGSVATCADTDPGGTEACKFWGRQGKRTRPHKRSPVTDTSSRCLGRGGLRGRSAGQWGR